MNPAIYYHPEAYTTSGPQLMGRNAAGESFLRGFLTYARNAEFWVQVEAEAHARHFAETAMRHGRTEPVRGVDKRGLGRLARAGVVFHPGPGIGTHAWQRRIAGPGDAGWSLCGVTHTTSSARAMDALVELLTTPVQPWDAVICTSTAVRANVDRMLEAQADFLRQRLGAQRIVLPQLPVIPLGIHTADFAYSTGQRAQSRLALGADEKTHVVLYTGRLSFHAKAHPLAMYQALQAAAQALPAGERVLLVECGWHANEHIRKAYADAAALACPAVEVRVLDGRKAEERQVAWAGADVFCSLSDNIQETFGIVPIEAMAAGLPVVVSDWDGYRDTVRHGIDGFRVPTIMPGAGLGTDLALRHALEVDTYDMYCGHSCSLVAVDVAATARAFGELFASPDLRRRMGDAGRQRARAVYDWKPIIARYEELWAELEAIRARDGAGLAAPRHPWPARLDPFRAFAGYPTAVLGPETVLDLAPGGAAAALERAAAYRKLAMVDFARLVYPSEAEVATVIENLSGGPRTVREVSAAIPAERRTVVMRGLAWLLKLGIITTPMEVPQP